MVKKKDGLSGLGDAGAFAQTLLASLGLPASPLEATDSWSNRVWLGPTHVVRLSSGRFRDAFAYEQSILQLLPPTVPHAQPIAYGRSGQQEWLVLRRVPGHSLASIWSHLSEAQRRAAITALGHALRALHAVPIPAGLENPWLTDALAPGGRPRDAYHAPPARYEVLLAAAAQVPGVDHGLLTAVGAFIEERLDAFIGDRHVLVHCDLHFDNVLWDNDHLTALLDFEGARPAPPDQELDTLLRCVREPENFAGPVGQLGPARAELAAVPDWLAAAYPDLFTHPRLPERLAVYEALWRLVQLLHFPPGTGPPDPYSHLTALLEAGSR